MTCVPWRNVVWHQDLSRSGPYFPSSRKHHSCVTWDGSWFLFGGIGIDEDGVVLNDFWVYRFSSNTWRLLNIDGEVPEARYGHGAVAYQGQMWVMGGCNQEGKGVTENYTFDFHTFKWSLLECYGKGEPTARWGQSSVVSGDSLYVFGGRDSTNIYGNLYEFHFSSRTWYLLYSVPPLFIGRDKEEVTKEKENSNINSTNNTNQKNVENSIDNNENTPSINTYCYFCGAVSYQGSLYFFRTSNNYYHDTNNDFTHPGGELLCYCIKLRRWMPPIRDNRYHYDNSIYTSYDDNNFIRKHPQLLLVRDTIAIFGGNGKKREGNILLVSPKTGSWLDSGIPCSLSGHSLCLYQNYVYTVFGGENKQFNKGMYRICSDALLASILPKKVSTNAMDVGCANVKLKVSFDGDTRVLLVNQNSSLGDLLSQLKSEFQQDLDNYHLSYHDSCGDVISVRSDQGLRVALNDVANNVVNSFKLVKMRQSTIGMNMGRNSTSFSPLASPQRTSVIGFENTNIIQVQHRPNEYRLGHSLGSGSYGSVYLAMNPVLGEMIAVKKIAVDTEISSFDSKLESLGSEIDILSRLHHQNIVQYLGYDVDIANQCLNIFVEYVPGGSLKKFVSEFGSLPENLISRFTFQILQGLRYLHRKGVIHRDIKGANILIDQFGTIKLCDFGAAAKLKSVTTLQTLEESDSESGGKNSSGLSSVKGTAYWMAPEVIRGSGYGRRCDVWSVGCTVVELLTGKPPWSHLSPVAALFQIASDEQGPPSLPSDISSELQDFILNNCLVCSQLERPSVKQLLQHPFVETQYQEHSIMSVEAELAEAVAQYRQGGDPSVSSSLEFRASFENTPSNDNNTNVSAHPTRRRKSMDAAIRKKSSRHILLRRRPRGQSYDTGTSSPYTSTSISNLISPFPSFLRNSHNDTTVGSNDVDKNSRKYDSDNDTDSLSISQTFSHKKRNSKSSKSNSSGEERKSSNNHSSYVSKKSARSFSGWKKSPKSPKSPKSLTHSKATSPKSHIQASKKKRKNNE